MVNFYQINDLPLRYWHYLEVTVAAGSIIIAEFAALSGAEVVISTSGSREPASAQVYISNGRTFYGFVSVLFCEGYRPWEVVRDRSQDAG